jgi:hypothetical protein
MTQISPGKQNMSPWPWSHLDGADSIFMTQISPCRRHYPDLTSKAICDATTQISAGRKIVAPWPRSHLRRQASEPWPRSHLESKLWRYDPDLTWKAGCNCMIRVSPGTPDEHSWGPHHWGCFCGRIQLKSGVCKFMTKSGVNILTMYCTYTA